MLQVGKKVRARSGKSKFRTKFFALLLHFLPAYDHDIRLGIYEC
ncbi:hypothetical protein SDC9_75046 [bioreactor metagenome]|uniref:Uncharacterized protein n=1 Tax=bioreactor metagenome TaxID=1076179 RepID=A0A644YJG1_9ZZZZ